MTGVRAPVVEVGPIASVGAFGRVSHRGLDGSSDAFSDLYLVGVESGVVWLGMSATSWVVVRGPGSSSYAGPVY